MFSTARAEESGVLPGSGMEYKVSMPYSDQDLQIYLASMSSQECLHCSRTRELKLGTGHDHNVALPSSGMLYKASLPRIEEEMQTQPKSRAASQKCGCAQCRHARKQAYKAALANAGAEYTVFQAAPASRAVDSSSGFIVVGSGQLQSDNRQVASSGSASNGMGAGGPTLLTSKNHKHVDTQQLMKEPLKEPVEDGERTCGDCTVQ
jgi:hypothetical protein